MDYLPSVFCSEMITYPLIQVKEKLEYIMAKQKDLNERWEQHWEKLQQGQWWHYCNIMLKVCQSDTFSDLSTTFICTLQPSRGCSPTSRDRQSSPGSQSRNQSLQIPVRQVVGQTRLRSWFDGMKHSGRPRPRGRIISAHYARSLWKQRLMYKQSAPAQHCRGSEVTKGADDITQSIPSYMWSGLFMYLSGINRPAVATPMKIKATEQLTDRKALNNITI